MCVYEEPFASDDLFRREWSRNRVLARRMLRRLGVRGDEAVHLAQIAFWEALNIAPDNIPLRNTVWWRRLQDWVAALRSEARGPYNLPEKQLRGRARFGEQYSLEECLRFLEETHGRDDAFASAFLVQDSRFADVVFWETVRVAVGERAYFVLWCHFKQGLEAQEIACLLGLKRRTVYQILRDSYRTLRGFFADGV